MKRLLFGSSMFILLMGMTSLVPVEKQKYSSPEAKFTLTFPGEYSITEETQETYNSVKCQASVNDMVFLMIYTVHDLEISETEKLAQISLDAFMEGIEGETTKTSTWKVKKNNGLMANFEASNKEFMGDYRVVIIDQIQYQITVVSSKESWNQKMADKFFKSFKVKK